MGTELTVRLRLLLFVIYFTSNLSAEEYIEPQIPQFLKSKYGSQLGTSSVQNSAIKTSYVKSKTSYGGGAYSSGSYSNPYVSSSGGSHLPQSLPQASYANSYTNSKTHYGGSTNYREGCTSQPPSPINAGMRCSSYSGCQANCLPNYQFPNGQTQVQIVCENGEWKVKGTDWTVVPSCEPICLPECQNAGICVAPDQCNCPENFSGPQCQFENKPCLNFPLIPMNSKRMCRSNQCTISCMPGHSFSDGSSIATMICKGGQWVPTKERWVAMPDCLPTCKPLCLNGGVCLSFNVCQCPQEFRGPQCQYRADACSSKNLPFNGGYNCSGDMESFTCSLTCPEGIPFEFQPEPIYTCLYSTGIFVPNPIPQCLYGQNVQLISHKGSDLLSHSNTDYTIHNTENGDARGDIPKVDYNFDYLNPSKDIDDINKIDYVPLESNGPDKPKVAIVEQALPKPGVCFSWGGMHHKTFDGKIFSFDSKCSHILVRDALDNTFSIAVENAPSCYTKFEDCYKITKVYFQDKEYILKKSDEGFPIFASTKKVLPIPGQVPGIRVEVIAHFIILSIDPLDVTLRWDGQQLVYVEIKESLWNRTEGLCGRIDGDINNDLTTKDGTTPKSVTALASSWIVEDLENICLDVPSKEHACPDDGLPGSLGHQATQFCKKLLYDPRFQACSNMVDIYSLLDACRWDYCSCKQLDPTECACETLNVYVRDCVGKGIKDLVNWRDENTCPMKCTNGKVYKSCGSSKSQASCGVLTEIADIQNCEEGCYCPEGTVLHEDKCITKDKCPCKLRGKSFAPGSSVPKDCNTCTCNDGQWICTQVSCGARCAAVGDPHYSTFDGKRFDFMGQCSYYLLKNDNLSIEAENVACAGAISEAMNFPMSVSAGLPSCTKTVTIKTDGQVIKLKQNHNVVVNGQDISKVPYTISGINIRSVSSIFLQVELTNGIEIWWDGVTRVYIDLPASYKEKTKGLCGTFNNNQKDDFITPEGDVEQVVIPFANKWKTSENCNDIPEVVSTHPCDLNIHNKVIAEKHCSKIKSDLFKDCHIFVDPEQYYQDCLYDMCACEFKVSKCLCPTMSAYATECSRKGVKIDWRNDVRECGIHCPGGQKYQVCGNSCTRTCSDISIWPDCKIQCVEGCNCPEGEALDNNGECIPIGQCKCQHEGLEFPAGYKEVRPASKGPELCTCTNAVWVCKPATESDSKKFPKVSDQQLRCDASKNFEFTTCENVEPVTCKNMHTNDHYSPAVCHSGCNCKEGYVLDTKNRICVKPTECPCHHGGRSYKENSVVQSDCNTCTCRNGKWNCTDRICSAECSAWGDSHFKTFDGKHYDYQGQCDYMLAKGSLGTTFFEIIIQNVPCGSLGTSCSKSITIRLNSGSDQETVVLTRDKPVPRYSSMKHLTLREVALFVIVEAPDMSLVVHWDRGTRVYVTLDPRWKAKMKGLCGNYNDDEGDDFETPSGGLFEVSAQLFGDSWKLQSYCPEALEILNTCDDRPDRKVWALKQCGIMKSQTFIACHAEVPYETYFEKCVFDSCACDQGGDCECLCTAIAAYAQECNNRGVPVHWRSQHLCPIECDERCSTYSPCISTCPLETCDNLLSNSKLTKSCKEDTCVEGCNPKPCPPDHVYLNSSYTDCVPRNSCKLLCLEDNEISYYEGDVMEEDDCHTCSCSRGQKICKGQPCSTTPAQEFTTHQLEQKEQCKPGWTKWVNQDKLQSKSKSNKKLFDFEPIPSEIILNNLKESSRCSREQIVDIECRTVGSHKSAKETGADVECSLENGLICKVTSKGQYCPDFEIRVLCECETPTTEFIVPMILTEYPHMNCDITKPNHEHPTDCYKFYECQPDVTGGYSLVEKTCGPMMYNPQTMTCDWPEMVMRIRNSCAVETVTRHVVQTPECPPGKVKDDCAIECDKLCLHYSFIVKEQGLCLDGVKCEAGCVNSHKKRSCPPNNLWADENTCVSLQDCLCISDQGKAIKPGQTVYEDTCKQCQCINNFYTCHEECEVVEVVEPKLNATEAKTQEQVAFVEEKDYKGLEILRNTTAMTLPPIIIQTSVTPPPICEPDRYIDLIQGDQPLPDSAFSASSVLSPSFAPSHARLDSKITEKSGGSWAPQFTNNEQFLEVNLGNQEPVYGVIVRGSPLYDEYVTSYQVLYSPDGHTFYYILNNDSPPRPRIFRGSVDSSTPIKQIFETPIEAKIVKINPQTWNNGISLRVELVGCSEEITTSQTTPIYDMITTAAGIKPQFCDDEMGLSDGTMSALQISVSSEKNSLLGKNNIRLNSGSFWQPFSNSPNEWVEFDFLEPRTITAVVTKGGDDGWVTAFVVKYSHNGKEWNTLLDDNQKDKVFLGNYNGISPQVNNFALPINAQYLKLVPIKWNKNIQLRVEVHGCFKVYRAIQEPTTTTTVKSSCNNCPGVDSTVLELSACRCDAKLWWDGEGCVNRTQCPCMVGHMPYGVGKVFQKEDCSECICELGGISRCTPKTCGKCKDALKSAITSTCACTCQPCPEGTVLCPTSDICINSTLWCNGVQDCPDDELDCTTTVEITTPKVTTTTKKPKTCPVVECQIGYRKVEKEPSKMEGHQSYISPMISEHRKHTKGSYQSVKGGVKTSGYKPTYLSKPQNSEVAEELVCKEYVCVSSKPSPVYIHSTDECPPVICQANYIPVFDSKKSNSNKVCPSYSCYPPPEPDVVCNVTGRTFNTFDNTEYKYDICNHVLGRDLENYEWDVSLKKNCTTSCSRDLVIRHKDDIFIMYSDLSLSFNGYKYTAAQANNIDTQNNAFTISQLGNTILFLSNRYGFWIIWNTLGDVKFGVVHKLIEKVDGLCGFFNDNSEDDKRKPDGGLAKTTVEFGDSWALSHDQPTICEAKACPLHIQNKAWEMCNKVKEQPLSACAKVMYIEAFISRCLETTCACLEHNEGNHTAEEECRCSALQSFVVDCLSAESTIDLSDWRMQQDCPTTCESPLVYHDCFQRKCEPTCESISDPNVCPKISNICFPGCYCPAGYVRKDESCIKPSNCRDCECNVLPHLQYVTYDESNFTVSGNCVYVMSRDVAEENDQHKFQVLVTNHPCKHKPEKMCVGKVTILYQGHKIHILVDYIRNKLKLIVDNERIDDYEDLLPWATVKETTIKHMKMLLVEVQVEVSIYYPSLGISVKAPSHKYKGKLEGLCGDCNGDPQDDVKKPDGKKPEDTDDFALSWLYEHLPGGQSREECHNEPEEKCGEISEESDPCMQLLDTNKFGQCLNIFNPTLFIEWCKKDTCNGNPEQSCTAIEAYARDCASAGFCVNWRQEICPPKSCPADQYFDPCGTSDPDTCESVKIKERRRLKAPTEGCYCPQGKVLLNNTCVEPKDCEVCDDEGHHPGDKWKKDKCTTCKCEGTSLKCETEHCTSFETVCQRGYTPMKIPSKEEECCNKFVCVPEATVGPTCETPQKLQCGPGQVMKLDTKPNGCQTFICECKPVEDCDQLDLITDAPLDPGYVKEVDESGCCPVINIVCKKDLCLEAKECPVYHSLKTDNIPGKCCPLYSCEPPKDKCIYETQYTAASTGGERLLTKYEKQKLLKNANETWNDGPCRECKCELTSIGNYQPSCSQAKCELLQHHEDFKDFVLEEQMIFEQCCPKIKRTACKYNGEIYKVGQKWTKGNDYCVSMECVETENGIRKETTVKTCTKECDLGYEYIEPKLECCGSCKQIACVVDGKVYKNGEEWTSADHCTNYFCMNLNGSLQVQAVKVNCPELPEEHYKDFVVETYQVGGKCCKEYKQTACKVDNKVYQIGETWPDSTDKCKKISCVKSKKNELSKQESIESCKKDCKLGWEYKASSTSCCGECVQIACVHDGEVKKLEETWTSRDNCTTYTCENLSDGFVVSSQQESCPSISDCPDENIFIKGCCKHCNITHEDQKLCFPEPMSLNKTIGLIRENRLDKGECRNKEPIPNFTECVGSCHSSTFFNIKSGLHESVCSCCQATKYKSLEVTLECENGVQWMKKVAIPAQCDCTGCAAEKK